MKLSYYTIIGRDARLFKWHVDNVLRNSGLSRDLWDFNVVVYKNNRIPEQTTAEILELCKINDINWLIYNEPHDNFLINLYNSWNLGYTLGKGELVLRAGSDQAFSPGCFAAMLDAHNSYYGTGELITQMHTVESPLAGPGSRHWVMPFGNNWQEFKEDEFVKFCQSQAKPGLFGIEEALRIWKHPTSFNSSLGHINRVDGVSWLMSRELFKKIGPMPAIENGHTGDVIIHDRATRAGIPELLVGDAFSYHLVRGEARQI